MYALNNLSFANQINWPNLSERFFGGPTSFGTKGNDYFRLDSKSSGVVLAGRGNDVFEYGNDPGKLDTLIAGGRGEDTLSFNGLTQEAALTALKNNGYTFVQFPNGFGLKTKEGQLVKVIEVEKLSFTDKTFNLLNQDDLQSLVNAISAKGIPVEKGNPGIDKDRCDHDYPVFNGYSSYRDYNRFYYSPYSTYSNPWTESVNSIARSFGDTNYNSLGNSFNNFSFSQPQQYYGGPSSFSSSLAFNGTGSLNSSLSFNSGGLSSLY